MATVSIKLVKTTTPKGSPLAFAINGTGAEVIALVPHATVNGVAVPTRVSYVLTATPGNERLAERLVKAFNSGDGYYDAKVQRDHAGIEYVTFSTAFLMRTLHADLARLGY